MKFTKASCHNRSRCMRRADGIIRRVPINTVKVDSLPPIQLPKIRGEWSALTCSRAALSLAANDTSWMNGLLDGGTMSDIAEEED